MCCLGLHNSPLHRALGVASLKLYSWAFWTDSVPFSTPCSYHHALALIRFYGHCCWLSPALLSPEQAANLPTHSMKSTLLAAAGQLNMSLENRAKQAHHKKSVQLYSRDDVWPSLFLQRDILVDVSTGWRPLTTSTRCYLNNHFLNLGFAHRSFPKKTSIWSRCHSQKQLHRLRSANRRLTQVYLCRLR